MRITSQSIHAALAGLSALGFSFSVTRNGAAINPASESVQPDDTISVVISGAAPNSIVQVSRNNLTNALGFTTASGGFHESWQGSGFPPATYVEQWFVGGAPVGSDAFHVGGSGGTGPNPTPPPGTPPHPTLYAIVSKGEGNGALYLVGSDGLYLFPDYNTFTGCGYSSPAPVASAAQMSMPVVGSVSAAPACQPVPYTPAPAPAPTPTTGPVPPAPPVPTGGGGNPNPGPGPAPTGGGGSTGGGDTGGSGGLPALPPTIGGIDSRYVLLAAAAIFFLLMVRR